MGDKENAPGEEIKNPLQGRGEKDTAAAANAGASSLFKGMASFKKWERIVAQVRTETRAAAGSPCHSLSSAVLHYTVQYCTVLYCTGASMCEPCQPKIRFV